MKTLACFLVFGCLFGVTACDRAVGLPVADAKPVAVMPALHPALAHDAADGYVYEYSQ